MQESFTHPGSMETDRTTNGEAGSSIDVPVSESIHEKYDSSEKCTDFTFKVLNRSLPLFNKLMIDFD